MAIGFSILNFIREYFFFFAVISERTSIIFGSSSAPGEHIAMIEYMNDENIPIGHC